MEEALTPDSDDSALSDEEDAAGGGRVQSDEDEGADKQQAKVFIPKALSAFLERLPPR